MILKETVTYPLDKEYHKVHYAIPAYDDHLVFSAILGFKKYAVTHLDENSKVVGKLLFTKPKRSLVAYDRWNVVILAPE